MRYFVMNKPPGCITGRTDPAGRPTVYAHVPPHFPPLPHVGRLDFNTEGLLLFTDDGRLAQAMLNAGFSGEASPALAPALEKVYHVKVRGLLQDGGPSLASLALPLVLPDTPPTTPARVRLVSRRSRATWVELELREGRHHQVRRLCARAGLQIVKLRRVRLGPLELGELPLRWCRPLTATEVAACYARALPADPMPAVEPIDDSREAYASARARQAPDVGEPSAQRKD